MLKKMKYLVVLLAVIFMFSGCQSYEIDFDLSRLDTKTADYDVFIWYRCGLEQREIIYSGFGYRISIDSVEIWKREKTIDCEKVIEFHKKYK